MRKIDMSKVSKDIIDIKFKPSDTLQVAMNKFYFIMRRHGIKEGTSDGKGGRIVCNYEWTMCMVLFIDRIEQFIRMASLFGKMGTPKDLLK